MSPTIRRNPKARTRNSHDNAEAERSETLIFSGDAEHLVGICDGPDESGQCPWKSSNGVLPCNGAWLVSNAWSFKVAEEAQICPLAALGLSPTE